MMTCNDCHTLLICAAVLRNGVPRCQICWRIYIQKVEKPPIDPTPIHDGLAEERDNKSIPIEQTPIYAQMIAEREGRGRFSRGGLIKHTGLDRDGIAKRFRDLEQTHTLALTRHGTIIKKGRKP